MNGPLLRRSMAALCWFPVLVLARAMWEAAPALAEQRYLELGLHRLAALELLGSIRLLGPALLAIALGLVPLVLPKLARITEARPLRWLALACALGLFGVGALSRAPRGDPDRPNLVLITVDTLRADHLGAYGYPRATSSALDRMASEGLLFRHANSQAPWTLPSMATVMTGLYPSQHGATRAKTRVRESHLTVAEVLRDAGYETLAVTSHVFVAPRFGLGQGFAHFDHSQVLGEESVTSEKLSRIAIEFIRERERSAEPYFLWVHYFDPHFSYRRHPEFDFAGSVKDESVLGIELTALEEKLRIRGEARPDHPEMQHVRNVYDEEVAYTDRWIGRLAEQLRSGSGERPFLLFVTADHGEEFLEHGGTGHGPKLYEELIHVPLIVWGDLPRALRQKVAQRSVELASLPRTLVEAAGVEARHFAGENLLDPELERAARPAFSESTYAFGSAGRARSVTLDGWKLIHDLEDGSRELFHLPSDPGEQRDRWLDPDTTPIRERLSAELGRFSELEAGEPLAVELDAVEEGLLRDLGYLE